MKRHYWVPPLLVLLVHLTDICLGEFEPAYFKICSRDIKHEVDSTDCEKGIWLKKSIEPNCVCIRGVWALSDGMCDGDARILVGDGHCFHVPRKIRSAKLIGDPRDPFKPAVYLTPGTLDAVYELQEGKYTPDIQSESTIIVGVNPRQVAQQKDKKVCVDLDQDFYHLPVHIYKLGRRTSTQWTLDKKKEYLCPSIKGYDEHLSFGDSYHYNREKKGREEKLMVERNCKSECPGEISKRPMGRTMDDGNDFDAPTAVKRGPKPVKTMAERNLEKEEMRAKSTEDPAYYEKEVNEQTLRMMHAHISPLLLNITGHQVVTNEYRYFQEIRQVVEKACPNDYVPKGLVKGLMRMFRQLLWETQDAYFHHIQNNNEEQFKRILERLQECNEKTPDPSVRFATYSEAFKPNATPPMEPPAPERCPEPLIYAVNGSNYNRTDIGFRNLYLNNISELFYPHLKFNSSQVDFVIEAAWKITMIGHYRCSRYFDDQTAVEFSQFFHQVQSFFNPRIIKRWYYEQSIMATHKIVKMIFPSYDLKRFMFGLDACLVGTQGFSNFDFANIWIQRPKIPMTQNDLIQKKHILPGATSRLSTLDYSPDRKKDEKKTDNKPEEKKKGKRRRREATGFHLWSSSARCIEGYMDPIFKRKEYNYHLPSGCLPPEL